MRDMCVYLDHIARSGCVKSIFGIDSISSNLVQRKDHLFNHPSFTEIFLKAGSTHWVANRFTFSIFYLHCCQLRWSTGRIFETRWPKCFTRWRLPHEQSNCMKTFQSHPTDRDGLDGAGFSFIARRVGDGCRIWGVPGSVISGGELNFSDTKSDSFFSNYLCCLLLIQIGIFMALRRPQIPFFVWFLFELQPGRGSGAPRSKQHGPRWPRRRRSVGIGALVSRTGKSCLPNATCSHNFKHAPMLRSTKMTQSPFWRNLLLEQYREGCQKVCWEWISKYLSAQFPDQLQARTGTTGLPTYRTPWRRTFRRKLCLGWHSNYSHASVVATITREFSPEKVEHLSYLATIQEKLKQRVTSQFERLRCPNFCGNNGP